MSKIKPFTKAQQRIIAAVPTNWCDSLLTGPDGLGPQPWDCRHIEKLLRGVQDRVKAAIAKASGR